MAITPEEADERRLAAGLDRARLAALDWAEKADAAQLRAERHLQYVAEHGGKTYLADAVARERRLAQESTARAAEARGLAEMWAHVGSLLPPSRQAHTVTVTTAMDPGAVAEEIQRVVTRYGRGQQPA